MKLERGESKSGSVVVEGHKMHIRATREGASDYGFLAGPYGIIENDSWSFFIVCDEVVQTPDDDGNLITGVNINFARDVRNYREKGLSPDDRFKVMYLVITNTPDQEKLQRAMEDDAGFKEFAKADVEFKRRKSTLSEAEADFYRSLYPDFPVLEGYNQWPNPFALLLLNELENKRGEKPNLAPFFKFIEFIDGGKLLAPELAKALAETIRQCIPSIQYQLVAEAAIEDSETTVVSSLPADYREPGTRPAALEGFQER